MHYLKIAYDGWEGVESAHLEIFAGPGQTFEEYMAGSCRRRLPVLGFLVCGWRKEVLEFLHGMRLPFWANVLSC